MKLVYPAVFHLDESGNYSATFPDLACCHAEGETIDDAVDNAHDAALNWLNVQLEDDDWDFPAASDPDEIEIKDGDIIRNIAVNIRFIEGWDE